MTEKAKANFRCWYFADGEGLAHMAISRAFGAVADGRNRAISEQEIAEGCYGIVLAKDNGRLFGQAVQVTAPSQRNAADIWPAWQSESPAVWDVVPTSEIREIPAWIAGKVGMSGLELQHRPRVHAFLQGRYDARIAELRNKMEEVLGAAFQELDGTPVGADLHEAGSLLLEVLDQYV